MSARMLRRFMSRLLPRSVLARNIALLIVLVAFTQVCSLSVLIHYVQKPRVERAAAVFGTYIKTLDNALAASPVDARDTLVARLDARSEPPTEAVIEPRVRLLAFYRTYQLATFLDTLHRYLPPGTEVRWQGAPHPRMWIRMHVAGTPYWIGLQVPEEAQGGGMLTAVLLSIGLGMIAALTGFALQAHLNRPLQELAQAARRVSAGEVPPPLPVDGPTEIAQVSGAFNQMTQALQQAEATRALMLAGISHDIRTPLTKLRLAMAMASDTNGDEAFVGAAESYLDQIDTILQQFMDYAGSGERETPQPGDLNALISQLAADFAGLGHEFDLQLGELPEHAFRPITMMRLVMNLMQNAVVYGQTGLAVRTWADAQAIHVAVADRGKGLSAEELERLKAPFQRGKNAHGKTGGTGLGLAIVERIARLHGGTLAFHAREGGGLEVWAVLPIQRDSSAAGAGEPATTQPAS
ncbi:ATP-binding protein [Paraburkholderia caribensis]|uniref:histidine kinase n=1 Tax=Paraburkholderia caribensis TaxID=75105 RepID=A0ABV0DQH6_9BURK|nr:ATP-binding protein [Paraburkholderia caribensis]MCO4876480.1 ATP-binding protein [Paraburkholderia caribensis]MDR6383928.1 two-component system osmolarity sensor histidine kinase EnvZ [Paraburkholderia caribensis]